ILLRAEHAGHIIAHDESRVPRRNHPPRASGSHDLSDSNRRYIGSAFVHPAAHGGIERKIQDFDQNLARPRLPHRFFHIIPVAALGQPDWPCRQTELMVGQVHSGSPFAVFGKAEATVYAPSRHSHHSEESASRPWWRSSRIQIGVILLPCTIGHDLACSNVLLLAAGGVSCIEYHAPSNVHTRCGGTVE